MIATDPQLFPNLRVLTAGRVKNQQVVTPIDVCVSDFENESFVTHSGTNIMIHDAVAAALARSLDKVTSANQSHVLISDLPTRDFVLKAPLSVILAEDDGEYRAEIAEVELYAFARTDREAIGELLEEFVDLCREILSKRDVELGASAKRWKHFLASIVK